MGIQLNTLEFNGARPWVREDAWGLGPGEAGASMAGGGSLGKRRRQAGGEASRG